MLEKKEESRKLKRNNNGGFPRYVLNQLKKIKA
jgi:hypothetical protein